MGEVGETKAMARDSTMDQQLTFWNRIKHSALEAAPSICQHPPKDIFTKIAIKRNSPSQVRQ